MGPQDKAGAEARTQVHNAKVSQSLNYKNALKALNALASRWIHNYYDMIDMKIPIHRANFEAR